MGLGDREFTMECKDWGEEKGVEKGEKIALYVCVEFEELDRG